MNALRGSVIGLAGVVGAGVLAWPAASAFADTAEVYQRDDQTPELVTVDDDDDGDSNRLTNTNTGPSRATNDNTRSNRTAVSRDRDRSRGDNTRDWTRDGGDRTRDWSANHTNDHSRNDTRPRPRR
ncbi:MAG TPA: hypothetical protein VFG72_14925 [Marmoricola sp.]|nr:hypothetical protein [Marmoricola sp.]